MKSGASELNPSPWHGRFLGVYVDHLPHWVVDCGRYAVTLRSEGPLPRSVRLRLEEIRESLMAVEPQSEAAEDYRRSVFRILEAENDAGSGFAPFSDPTLARDLSDWLNGYEKDGLSFSDFVIMPNHVHLITKAFQVERIDEFRDAWARFKGRSARWLNQQLNRSGPFWQRFWYDRWIRGPEELAEWQRYLQRNPLKAGLVREREEYPFLKIGK